MSGSGFCQNFCQSSNSNIHDTCAMVCSCTNPNRGQDDKCPQFVDQLFCRHWCTFNGGQARRHSLFVILLRISMRAYVYAFVITHRGWNSIFICKSTLFPRALTVPVPGWYYGRLPVMWVLIPDRATYAHLAVVSGFNVLEI